MTKLLRATIFVLAVSAFVTPVAARAATVSDLLFKNVTGASALSEHDKERIAAILPLDLGPNGLIDNNAGCRQESPITVVIRDLNGDGHPEVIISEGNGCLYGMRGSVTHFLAGDAQGNWQEVLRGDGSSYEIKASPPGSWPLILPGVMGFCYPIYGYAEAQKKYVLLKRVSDPQMPNACKNNFGQ
jgi:hypothetical protein